MSPIDDPKSPLSWKERVGRKGLIRRDITKDLHVTPDGMPIVHAYKGDFPTLLVSVDELSGCPFAHAWAHSFVEDLILERVWNTPGVFVRQMRKFKGYLSADFSMWLDMHPAEKYYNAFRNHALAQFAQNHGIPTIMTLSWAGYDTFDYAFDGIEPEGIYAVSNIGANKDFISRKMFRAGLHEAIRILNPAGLIFMGSGTQYRLPCEYRWFSNPNIDVLRNLK